MKATFAIHRLLLVWLLLVWLPAWSAPAAAATLDVVIDGVTGPLQENVAAFLRLQQLLDADKKLPGEARIRWLHDKAEDDIRQALAPFGYYKPDIDTALEQTADGWRANYRIAPGPALPIAAIDVQISGEGKTDASFQQALAAFPLATGDTLDQAKYEDFKQALQVLATERGYFDSRFASNEIVIDMAAYQATIKLKYDTGKRFQFGDIAFEQETLSEELLERFVTIQHGDPYYAPKLLQLQSDLLNSDYFESVEVNSEPDKAEQQILPVEVTAGMKKKRKYAFGLGYGTDTGIRGRGDFDQRWVNASGHRIGASLLAAQIKFALAGEYIIPGRDPRTDSFSIRGNVSAENSDVKEALAGEIGVTQKRQDGLWTKIASLDYRWEKFSFGDGDKETTALLIGGIKWDRIDAADRLYVVDGSSLNLEFRGGVEYVLSDISFAQAVVRTKFIKTFAEKNRLLLRAEAGATLVNDDDFDELPASLRFFAGGDNSVRGYSLDSIGPVNEAGDVIGGQHVLVGSVEYERQLLDNWGVAVFADVGSVFNDEPDAKLGVGIGARWRSPVGPVRVDIAHGLNEPGDSVRLHISIGPDL